MKNNTVIPIKVNKQNFYYLYFKSIENILNSVFSAISGKRLYLRDKEIQLLSEIARYYDEYKNEENIHRMVFHPRTRNMIMETLSMKISSYLVNMSLLMKYKMILGKNKDKQLNPLLIVNLEKKVRIILEFQDETTT